MYVVKAVVEESPRDPKAALEFCGPLPDYMLIGGERVRGRESTESLDPAAGKATGAAPAGIAADVDRAVEVSRRAQRGQGAKKKPAERSRILPQTAQAIRAAAAFAAAIEAVYSEIRSDL